MKLNLSKFSLSDLKSMMKETFILAMQKKSNNRSYKYDLDLSKEYYRYYKKQGGKSTYKQIILK